MGSFRRVASCVAASTKTSESLTTRFTATSTSTLSTHPSFAHVQTRDGSRAFPCKGVVHDHKLGVNLCNFSFHGVNGYPSLRPIAEHVLRQVAEHVLHHPIVVNLASFLTCRELEVEDLIFPGLHQNTDTRRNVRFIVRRGLSTPTPLGFAFPGASSFGSSSLSGHGFQPKPETNSQGSVLS